MKTINTHKNFYKLILFFLILFLAILCIFIFFFLQKEVKYLYSPPEVIVERILPDNYSKGNLFNVSLNIKFSGDFPERSVLLLGEVFPGGEFGGTTFNSFGKLADVNLLALMESPVVNKTIVYNVRSFLDSQTFSGKWALEVYNLDGKVNSTYEGIILGNNKINYASQEIISFCNNNGSCDLGENKTNCAFDCKCDFSSECNDGLFCTVDYCFNGKCSTSVMPCNDGISCTQDVCDKSLDKCIYTTNNNLCSNLSLISSCNNNPDSNPFTWDFSQAVSGVCEAINGCANLTRVYSHECRDNNLTDTKIGITCNAPCDENSDCLATICPTPRCVGRDYYYYDLVKNNCTPYCNCQNNSCGSAKILVLDPRCGECSSNSDCMSLNRVYCNNQSVLNESWFCNSSFRCDKNSSLLSNCASFNKNSIASCNGTKFEFFAGFLSDCSGTNICSKNNFSSLLTCSKSCGAVCESDSDCSNGQTCNLENCSCVGEIVNLNVFIGGNGGGGGGGGGGSCISNWNCSWQSCINGTESKICIDLKKCNTNFLKYSNESRKCELNNQVLNNLNNETPSSNKNDKTSFDYSIYYPILKIIGIILGSLIILIALFFIIFRKIKIKNIRLDKINKSVILIKELRLRGYQDSVIRQMFIKKGWEEDKIKNIFELVDKG